MKGVEADEALARGARDISTSRVFENVWYETVNICQGLGKANQQTSLFISYPGLTKSSKRELSQRHR